MLLNRATFEPLTFASFSSSAAVGVVCNDSIRQCPKDSRDMKLSYLLYIDLIAFFVASLVVVRCQTVGEEQIQFDVMPSGSPMEVSKTQVACYCKPHIRSEDGFTCQFSYNAQGGTKEQWLMILSQSADKKQYVCEVERPNGQSYLFFNHFRLNIKGANLQSGTAVESSKKVLNSNEYTVDPNTNSVAAVPGKFRSQLTKVRIVANKQKQEL